MTLFTKEQLLNQITESVDVTTSIIMDNVASMEHKERMNKLMKQMRRTIKLEIIFIHNEHEVSTKFFYINIDQLHRVLGLPLNSKPTNVEIYCYYEDSEIIIEFFENDLPKFYMSQQFPTHLFKYYGDDLVNRFAHYIMNC